MNTLNGYSKSTLTDMYVLTAAGGHLAVGNAANNIPLNNSTVNTNLNADLLDGTHKSGLFTALANINNSDYPESIYATIGGTTKYLKVNYSQASRKLFSSSAKNVGGLSYYYTSGTSSTDNTGNWVGPISSTTYMSILRLQSHTTAGALYYRDLIFDVNSDKIWSRRVTNSRTPSLTQLATTIDARPSGYLTSSTASLSSYWGKLWELSGVNSDNRDITFYIHSAYNNLRGFVHLNARRDSTTTDGVTTYSWSISLRQISGNLPKDGFRLYYNNSGLIQLWCNVSSRWGVYNCTIVSSTLRVSNEFFPYIGTLYSTNFTTAQTLPTDSYVELTNVYEPYYVTVNQHTSNSTEYPIVWSNSTSTSSTTGNQLYKSYSDLIYSPANKRITVKGYVETPKINNASGVLTLNGKTNIYLKINDTDSQAINFASTYFKPFGSAKNLIDLGVADARWKGVYANTGDFTGNIQSAGFVKSGSSNSYVLLGGGGHKALSDFAMASAYVKKAGDTMTGRLTMSTTITDHATPTVQCLVINSAAIPEGTTLTLKNAPGIGFHVASLSWGSLVFNGKFNFINNAADGYMDVNLKALSASTTINAYNQRFNYGLTYYNTNTATVTGTIVITLPNGWNASMNTYEIDIYEYKGYDEDAANIQHSKIIVSGYNYSTDAKWVNYGYQQIGSYNKGVRLGYNGSKCCILLGTTTTTWAYPQVHLSRVITGYSNQTAWSTGYSISVITSESSYSKIVTANRTRQYFADVVANNFRGTLIGTATKAEQLIFNEIGSLDFNTMYGDTYRGTAWYGGGSNGAVNNPLGNGSAFGMQIWRNAAGYTAQLIMTSTGKLTSRYWEGSTWSSLKTFAYTSDIPTVTNYYWANIKISASAVTNTSPTFGSVTIGTEDTAGVITMKHDSANYIKCGTTSGGSGYLAIIPGGQSLSLAAADLVIASGKVYPGTTNVTDLGNTDSRWLTVYAKDGNYTNTVQANRYYLKHSGIGTTYGDLQINTVGTACTTAGTQGTVGVTYLLLGNSIAVSTTAGSGADNAQGILRIYGTNTGYTNIRCGTHNTSGYNLYLPGENGQFVVHTNDTAIGSASTPVYIAASGVATACTIADGSGDVDRKLLVTNGSNGIYSTATITGNYVTGNLISTRSGENPVRHTCTNEAGSVSLLTHTNRGLYDSNNAYWMIYSTKGTTNVYIPKWASKGSATQPVYFNSSGEPVACTSYVNYIKWTSADASQGVIGKLTLGSTTNTLYDLFITSNGTVIADNTDLNTIKTPGIRYSGFSTNSATMANAPWTSSGFRLITLTGYGSASSYNIQLAHGSQHFFWRLMGASNTSPSSWYSWIKFKYGTAVGNSTTPVYINSEGVPTACTSYTSALDSRYVNVTGDTMTGNLTVPQVNGNLNGNITKSDPQLCAASENNNINIVNNANSAITTNAPTSMASITKAIRFRWYDTYWQIGNIRGSSSGTDGFGITYSNNNLCFRVTTSGTYSYYNMYAPHFYEDSDINLKINIQEIINSDKIPIIKEFDWKEDGSHSYGLIAQELEEQGYSELVNTKDNGYKTVNYSAALSLIVGKLQVKIKELEKEIDVLKNKN